MKAATHRLRWLLVAMLLMAAGTVAGQSAVVLPDSGDVERLQEMAWIQADDGTLPDYRDALASRDFRPLSEEAGSFEGRAWLRIPLQAPEGRAGPWVLEVKRRYFRVLELYVPDADGDHRRYSNSLAEYHPVRISAQSLIYPLDLDPGQAAELVIRVETLQGSLGTLDLSIQTERDYLGERSRAMWAFGLYFGAVIALVFYNLVLYLNLRTPGHRMYVLTISAVLLFMGLDSGLLQNALPASLRERELLIAAGLNNVLIGLTIAFYRVFASVSDITPRLSRALGAWSGLLFATGVLILVSPRAWGEIAAVTAQTMFTLTVPFLIAACVVAGRRGSTAAWIFLAAWSAFLAGGIIRSLVSADVLPRMPVTEYAVYVGSMFEAMILALGLSYRVGQLREQRIRAEHEQHRAMTLANQDALTGAYNRRFFENYLDTLLDDPRTSTAQGALLLIDIDWFKEINDTHGHEAGDVMLRSLTRRCLRELRDGDVLCRLGGDEFAIVLRSLSGPAAVDVARRIHAVATGRPVHYDGVEIDLALSIGVLAELEPGLSRSEALRRADRALYQAKEAGRNRVAEAGGSP